MNSPRRRRQDILFACICAYIVCQAYMIPLAPVGPYWALWPSAADIIVIVLAPLVLTSPIYDRVAKRLWRSLIIAFIVCLSSFVALTVFDLFGTGTASGNGKGLGWGEHGLYRLLQILIVYRAVSSCQFTEARLRTLRYLAFATFGFMCLEVCATYFQFISLPALCSRLPQSVASGAWWGGYVRPGGLGPGTRDLGLGAIGYNHGHVAMQLILAAMLTLFLNPGSAFHVAVLALCAVSVILSGSRAGVVAVLVFVILQLRSLKSDVFRMILALALCSVPLGIFMSVGASMMDPALERVKSIRTSYDSDGMSGRTAIWRARTEFIADDPMRWLVGTGFGSAIESGSIAHNMLLEVPLEMGLSGTLILVWLGLNVKKSLRVHRRAGRALRHGSAALLVTCLSQETFYPVPSTLHFLPFYFATVALCIRCSGSLSGMVGCRRQDIDLLGRC